MGRKMRLAPINRERWVKRFHLYRRLAVAGLLAGAMTIPTNVHHRILPRNVTVFMKHETVEDGREVAQRLHQNIKEGRVKVLALEQAHRTTEENIRNQNEMQKIRNEFEQWRMANRASEKSALQWIETRLSRSLRTEQGKVFVPIIAEALVYRLPIRYLENMTPEQSAKSKRMIQELDIIHSLAMNDTDIVQGFSTMKKYTEKETEYIRFRNAEMKEEFQAIQREFGNSGVFSTMGEQHYRFARETGNEIEYAQDIRKSFLAIEEKMENLDIDTRTARGMGFDLIRNVRAKFKDINQTTLERAYERIEKMTADEFLTQLRKLNFIQPPLARARAIIEALGK